MSSDDFKLSALLPQLKTPMWVDEWVSESSITETDYFSIIGKKIILAPAVVVVLVHVVVFGVPESEFVSPFWINTGQKVDM